MLRMFKKARLDVGFISKTGEIGAPRKLRRPRWFYHLHAALWGYFWLPCPLCEKNFSGYEWDLGPNSSIPTNQPGVREGVCPECIGKPKTLLPTKVD